MLDVRRLRVLREVGRHRSLSAAAAALSYTPSAISQQIRTLERELGAVLVERGARGAVLTDVGRLLIRYADEILGRISAAEEEVRAMLGLRAGRLRLGAFSTAGATLVPRAVKVFRDRHPEVEVQLVELDPEEAIEELRGYAVDLALVYEFPGVPGLTFDGFEYVPLLVDRLYIALPEGHRLASRRRVKLRELADDAWIQGVHRGSTAGVLPAACRAAGFEPRIVFRSDDHLAVQGSVAAGLGVAVVPQLTFSTARADIAIRPLEVEGDLLTREVGVTFPTRPYGVPAVTAMVEILKKVCAGLADEPPPPPPPPRA